MSVGKQLFSSASAEWLTPPEIVVAVCDMLGQIDLDPCAEDAKEVPASQHYTILDNGLVHPWPGRVYMNPPYGRKIESWVWKLRYEYENSKHTTEAIALVPARTDTLWWRLLARYPVCFIAGRLRFSGHVNAAPFPSAVIYLGPNVEKFVAVFGKLGKCYLPA